MKKGLCTLCMVLFVTLSVPAQETFSRQYFYRGNTIELPVNSNVVLAYFHLNQMDIASIHQKYNCIRTIVLNGTKADTLYACEVEFHGNSYDENVAWMREQPEVFDVEPVVGSETRIPVSNVFYVKIREASDTLLLKTEADRLGVHYNGAVFENGLWHQLSVSKHSESDALTISNQMGISGLFNKIDPGFVFTAGYYDNCVSDENYDIQWGLEAINACDAWNITTGSSQVNLAVIDQGIDTSHPEFIYTNVTSTYDMYYNVTPSIQWGYHGTHVAGIIFASHNDEEIAGVAPGVSLIDISDPIAGIEEDFAYRMSLAFDEAVQSGADIINCSWGLEATAIDLGVVSLLLEDAIQDAIDNGRSGKGCIVVFAAGNSSSLYPSLNVRYPANAIDEIIVVGAITSIYSRASFSCYGSQLDVVAPGSSIYSTILNHDYDIKSGTSMAAPHVSGVAALMLSANPNLTRKQIDRIIKGTTQKISGYTYSYNSQQPIGSWNSEVGHGLIDAFAAVEQAQSTSLTDLYIKDATDDTGIEPNTTSSNVNNSPDIKVYLSGSSAPLTSLEYGQTYTVKVTIRNLGGSQVLIEPSKIKIYWTVATPFYWQDSWTNAGYYCGFPKSGVVSASGFRRITVPANGSTTVSIPLTVPAYQTQFCLLPVNPFSVSIVAMVEDGQPIIGKGTSTYPVESFIRINNNAAWNSLPIISNPVSPDLSSNAITTISPNPSEGNVTIEFIMPDNISSANLYLINNSGQIVFHEIVNSDREQTIVHNLPTGTYTVLLEHDGILLGESIFIVK